MRRGAKEPQNNTKRWLSVAFLVLLFGACGLWAGNSWAIHRFRQQVRAHFSEDPANQELLRSSPYPYPFYRELLERDGLRTRDQIEPVIFGYESQSERPDSGGLLVCYDFVWSWAIHGSLCFRYDAQGQLVQIVDASPALLIVEAGD